MKTRKLLGLSVLVLLVILGTSLTMVQAQDATVIRIASQSPLSGPQSVLGISIRNSVELAISQLGGPLEEMGFTIEYVPFDDQATPDVGVANAQQIVNDPSILVVIGHLNSGVAIPSSEVYNDNDLAMVSPANTNPTVTDRGYPTVNRVCGRDDLQGPTGARFAAEELGVSSVYILHDTTAYGQGVAEFFRTEAEAIGLSVVGFEGTEETANFDSIIQPILALSPELIYFGGIYSQTGIFINQARAAGYDGIYMGPDGFDSSEFAELAGEAGVGTYYTSVAGPVSIYPNAAQFAADYEEAYGEPVQPFGAQSYDATAIALLGIQAAAEAAGGMPSRAEVAAAIRATEDYEGLTGTISFDDNGDPEIGLYYVIQVGSADPADWGSNELLATLEIPSPLTMAEQAAPDMATLVMGDPRFSTLVGAVLAADPSVLELLSSGEAFTLFAPTNDAFTAALEALGMDAATLMGDTALLTSILTYHVVLGEVTSDMLTDGSTLTTVNGADISVSVTDSGVVLNDTVNVIEADIVTMQGIIHVIDGVLVPPM